jgi:hypothetical protein
VNNAPVRTLQFMLKRETGKARMKIEKIESFETDSKGDVDAGKNMLFGAFVLVYVVDGYISVLLDENHANETKFDLKKGETLFIERDEDSSPTNILMNATNQAGKSAVHGIEATVLVIQIEEGKTFGGILKQNIVSAADQPPVNLNSDNDGLVPSQRRASIRRPSLLVPVDNKRKSNGIDLAEISDKLAAIDIQSKSDRPREMFRRDSLNFGSYDPKAIYEPPPFALMHTDTDTPPPVIRDKLEVEEFPLKTISTAWIKMMTQGLSEWLKLPIIICRGTEDG